MASDLQVRVLGAVTLARAGAPVGIGGPKPRLALALLAAHRGSVVSTDRICEELWGDDAPADPPAVLQSHLSRLRRLLRPDAEIAARPPGYALEIAAEALDAATFEHEYGLARATADPRRTVAHLDAALACWHGDAFEEFADRDWARAEAVRLDELRAHAQEDLLDARLALGEHAALVAELEALVAERPLRERLWQQLIVALYRSGRSAEALPRAEDHRRRFREELGLEPSPALRELEARVLADDPTLLAPVTATRPPAARRLPAEATALVGRGDELGDLIERARTDRLVTLTGPGGVGKTRLALRLATELWEELDGDVHMVELAPVHDPASTVAAIATALDVQQRQLLSVEETLIEYLRGRRALLVLDNCEHLLDTIAPLTGRLLPECPDVTIVATSREVLGLPGEHVWRVRPLALAPEGADDDAVAASAAVQLFVDRAAAARPGFALGPANTAAVAEIVRRLDGLPLAIELAAARLRAMSPAALAARLDQRFDLLAGAQTSMIERHRSLQDLVAWSHDLLGTDEQRLFARLCLFAGSFALDAVEGICAGDDLRVEQIPGLLANLVDKSMVQVVEPDRGRYRLLETLREFGREQLDSDERAAVRDRHAHWYLAEAERTARELAGPDEAEAVAELDRDFDNLRAAHHWSLEHADVDVALRLVAGLREYAFRRMRAEITSWSDAASALPGAGAHPRFPVVLAVAAYGRFVRGDLEAAIALSDDAIAAATTLDVDCSGLAERTLGNAWFYKGDTKQGTAWMDRMVASARGGSRARLAHALYMRSVAATSMGDTGRGLRAADECAAAARASGSPSARAQAAYAQGLAIEATDPAGAAELLQQSADLARDAGNRWVRAFALTEVLSLEAREGRPREALARYADVVDLWYRGGDWANQWLSLRHVFGILVQLRANLGAATLHGALAAAGAAYALPIEASDAARITALVDELRARLGPGAFASAVRRGAALSDAEIIEFARSQIRALAGDELPSAEQDEAGGAGRDRTFDRGIMSPLL